MDVFFPEVVDEAEVPGKGESFHFHRTDGEGEWLVRFEPDKTVVTREHAKGDMAVRGSASDILLFLWGRDNPDSQLDIVGDTSLIERYGELVDLS
jgi:predicted lipid carrier protein YhbT